MTYERGPSPEEMGLNPKDREIAEATQEASREAQELAQRVAKLEQSLYPGRSYNQREDINPFGRVTSGELGYGLRAAGEGRSFTLGDTTTFFLSKQERQWGKSGEQVLKRLQKLSERAGRTSAEEAEYQDLKGYANIDFETVGIAEDLAERQRKLVAVSLLTEHPYRTESMKDFSEKAKSILKMDHIGINPDDMTRYAQKLEGPTDERVSRPIEAIRSFRLAGKDEEAGKYQLAYEALMEDILPEPEELKRNE